MSQIIIDPNKLFACFCSILDQTVYLYFNKNNLLSTINYLKRLSDKHTCMKIAENLYTTFHDGNEFSAVDQIFVCYHRATQNIPYLLINYQNENKKLYFYFNKEGVDDLITSLNSLLNDLMHEQPEDISYMIAEWGQDGCILQNGCLIPNSMIICHLRLYGKLT